MSRKFQVGDRVRIIRSDHGHEGKLGTIVGRLEWATNRFTGERYQGHGINIDGIGTHDHDRLRFVARPARLVHVYDGDQASTWDQCCWRPTPIEAKAKAGD